jgi:hypothetical protein
MLVECLMVYLRPKIPAFIFFSLTSSELHIIYNNLLSFLTWVEDFIYYITDKGQLIYNNNPKLYEFFFKFKHLYPK